MIIGVPKEIKLQEHRIGLTPKSVKTLTDKTEEDLNQETDSILLDSIKRFLCLEQGVLSSDDLKDEQSGMKTMCEPPLIQGPEINVLHIIQVKKFEEISIKDIDDYTNMINLKTGALFAFSFKIGPMLMGFSQKEQRKMYDLGLLLGQLFQIQDDYLDLYGLELETGKSIGGDVSESKKTFLYITALGICNNEETKKFIKTVYIKPCSIRWCTQSSPNFYMISSCKI